MSQFLPCLIVVALTLSSCGDRGQVPPTSPDAGQNPADSLQVAPEEAALPALELVESWPVETSLDHAEIPDAPEVWQQMFAGATKSLELGFFYASPEPDGTLVWPLVETIEAAAARGVQVHCLFDKKFYGNDGMQQIPDRLAAVEGIEVRIYDFAARGGGVMHAKYFIVDGSEAFFGSQNFDERALSHIQELGMRVRQPALVAAIRQVFALDWALAQSEAELEAVRAGLDAAPAFPVKLDYDGAAVQVTPVFSPRDWLPGGGAWDLPALLAAIEGAQQRVRVQLLSYKTYGYGGETFTDLDDALRAAASRGVQIELLLADWNTGRSAIAGLKSLQKETGIEVRMVTIPEAKQGFIPFARVVHCKYMTVDGHFAWVGTSNWSPDYFYQSRNLGLVVEGSSFARDLDGFFEDLWQGPYVETVDPEREYEAKRIAQ